MTSDPEAGGGKSSGTDPTLDALLAAIVLAYALGVARVLEVALGPRWIVAGALLTIVIEALLYRGPAELRRRARDRRVAVGTAVAAVGAVVAGSLLAPEPTLAVAVGGLASYLPVLAGAAAIDRGQRRR